MNRKLVVIIVIVGGILLLALLILWLTTSSKTPSNECHCSGTEVCVNGKCLPSCLGPRVVPSGQYCDTSQLVCDPATKSWSCNGKCKPGYQGAKCNCTISDMPISDVCGGQIPYCNDDGNYVVSDAKSCADLNSYLSMEGITLAGACSKPPALCQSGQSPICLDRAGGAVIQCENVCPALPGPDDCNSMKCGAGETCLCDERTGNKWGCATVFNPSAQCGSQQSCCPPKPPFPTYCKDSSGHDLDLMCVPCINGSGDEGYINYCPGTSEYPFDCVKNYFQLDDQTNFPGGPPNGFAYTSASFSNLPVYPIVKNDNCLSGKFSNTKLQEAVTGYNYEMVPHYGDGGNLVYASDGKTIKKLVPFDDMNNAYLNASGSDYVENLCYWPPVTDDPAGHSVCSGNGIFNQYCCEPGSGDVSCSNGKPSTDSCPSGYKKVLCSSGDKTHLKDYCCNCNHYDSRQYVGWNCEYSDKDTCNNNGTVSVDGNNVATCSCNGGFAGSGCQYSRAVTCNNHGDPTSSGGCNCDLNWGGSDCLTPLNCGHQQCGGGTPDCCNGSCTNLQTYDSTCGSCDNNCFNHPACTGEETQKICCNGQCFCCDGGSDCGSQWCVPN